MNTSRGAEGAPKWRKRRVTHGRWRAKGGDDEPQHPKDPPSECVRQGQFEPAADEVDVLLYHGFPTHQPVITLFEGDGGLTPPLPSVEESRIS